MLNFGTSAFLKLVCLNDRPQRTELRNRLRSSGGGYDFHRSLRLLIERHLVGGHSIASLAGSIDQIAREPERKSVRIGLDHLGDWRTRHPGEILAYDAVSYESPGGLFKVTYTPDFGMRVDGQGVAVHVWNTARLQILREMTYAVLSLFKPAYEGVGDAPDDLAVLSLPDSELYRLSEAGAYASVGASLVARVETTVREVIDELDLPDGDEHPPTPQP
ncbi:MAG: hypothetical protein Q8N31_09230 [Reyranella sp.]|nr:hypothetical protein [Reyranella sp.]MDP3160185.1 hypothetical protein [Reyranella sp.]